MWWPWRHAIAHAQCRTHRPGGCHIKLSQAGIRLICTVRRRVYEVPDKEFRHVVSQCLSLREIIRTTGLHDHSNTYKRLRKRIAELDLDISHFRAYGRRPRAYTPDQLKDAVAVSKSIRQTLLALGIRGEGGNYKTVRRDIETLGIDTTHFTGSGWRIGVTQPITPPRPLGEVLVKDSTCSTSYVRKRLLRESLIEQRCQLCGISEWMGKSLTIELDHINGVHNDNRLENLRMLCPNCHSQTRTYRGRNRRRPQSPLPTQLCIL